MSVVEILLSRKAGEFNILGMKYRSMFCNGVVVWTAVSVVKHVSMWSMFCCEACLIY